MPVKKYLVYRKIDGLVINCIAYDDANPYELEADLAMEPIPAGSYAGIGWTRLPDGEYEAPLIVEDASE